MALLTQFGALVTMLKEEMDLSTDVAIGTEKRPHLMRAINRSYKNLAKAYDWPHLRSYSTRLTLAAGQQLYDFPATLDWSDIESVRVWYNNRPYDLTRGIGTPQYATFDPQVTGDRYDPAQRWDLKWSDTAVQYEIWPIPQTNNQTIEWTGRRKIVPLVDDADQCLLDDEVVVLFAAARLLKKKGAEDADLTLQEARDALDNIKKRTGPSQPMTIGLGEPGAPGGSPSSQFKSKIVISG